MMSESTLVPLHAMSADFTLILLAELAAGSVALR